MTSAVYHCGSCTAIKPLSVGGFICDRSKATIRPSDEQCDSHVLAPSEREDRVCARAAAEGAGEPQMGMFS